MTLSIAASGLINSKKRVELTSNNLANMTTHGFKRGMLHSADLGYRTEKLAGAPTSTNGANNVPGLMFGMGVREVGVIRVMEQGSPEVTDNPLDLMVMGEGYFQIENGSGETVYTRDGRFVLNADRQIVTLDGNLLQPNLTIPENSVSIEINQDGEVYAQIQGDQGPTLVGQIELAVFASPTGLIPLGDNLLKSSVASGEASTNVPGAIGYGSILQKALEASNVKPVVELTDLIEAQRAYAMNMKPMEAVQAMDANLAQLMR